jgi:hypothetical protein
MGTLHLGGGSSEMKTGHTLRHVSLIGTKTKGDNGGK